MQIETGFLCEIGCEDGARVICLFARAIQQLGVWTQKIQANVDYCCVWRRAECTSLVPGLKASKPVLPDSTLAAKRRAEGLDVVFFQASIRAQHDDLPLVLLLCVYSRMTRSHERRALGAVLFLVSWS